MNLGRRDDLPTGQAVSTGWKLKGLGRAGRELFVVELILKQTIVLAYDVGAQSPAMRTVLTCFGLADWPGVILPVPERLGMRIVAHLSMVVSSVGHVEDDIAVIVKVGFVSEIKNDTEVQVRRLEICGAGNDPTNAPVVTDKCAGIVCEASLARSSITEI